MHFEIKGDRALDHEAPDRLGFGPTATQLAEVLSKQVAKNGLVIGIEGKWGSGKSSLVNLTLRSLKEDQRQSRVHAIEFKPWLIGDRDALLASLFKDLAAGIDEIESKFGNNSGKYLRKAERASDLVRKFSERLTNVGKITKSAGIFIPLLGNIGAFFETVGDAANKKQSKPIADEKRKISSRLANLPSSLIVIIDDVDRLEPKEIIEILRLVRSVADFPNVTYILCYDIDIVTRAIQTNATVSDGRSFLEKIVQITVPVPVPETFDLRLWFEREIWNLVSTADSEEKLRITEIIDIEGDTYLTSPRSVNRTLDSIRFNWPTAKGRLDLSDFIWLEMIKVGNPELYIWIAKYLTRIASCAFGASIVSASEQNWYRKSLDRVLEKQSLLFVEISRRFSEFLPGIEYWKSQDDTPGIFGQVEPKKLAAALRQKRLSSPDHYRLYFAFSLPSRTIEMQDYQLFLNTLNFSIHDGAAMLLDWHTDRSTRGASKAEMALDRLRLDDHIILNPENASQLLSAFSIVADRLASLDETDFHGPDIWRRLTKALPRLLDSAGNQRSMAISDMFNNGTALSWLISVFRSELFAHGRVGNREKSGQIFSDPELTRVSNIMIRRFKSMKLNEFLNLMQPLSAFHAWAQAGDPDGPRKLLSKSITDDTDLVKVLEGISSQIRTNSTLHDVIRKENIEIFLDFDDIRSRIEMISKSKHKSDISLRAQAIMQKMKTAESF